MMGKFNKKVKGKEKKRLEEEQQEFNPSARDPYMDAKKKSPLDVDTGLDQVAKMTAILKTLKSIDEDDEE